MKDKKQTEKAGLEARIRRCETVRMWMIVLASILLVGGYASAIKPVIYACILPLAIAAVLTYAIKSLERSKPDD